MRLAGLSSLALGARASAGSSTNSHSTLRQLCTADFIQSVLPASNLVTGVVPSASSVAVNAVYNYSVEAGDLYVGKSGLDFCNVTFSYTHAGQNDTTKLWYWLPSPEQYQRRYMSTGGGGLAITTGQSNLEPGIVVGAAVGTTDGGFGSWSGALTDVLLLANGTFNYPALYAFGYEAIHEMTVLGKALTGNFYNSTEFYSYYSGCSEGGREGWSQLQRYGDDFDGAAIGAPAFRQAFQQVNHLFGNVVELTNGYVPSSCELDRIASHVIDFCDDLDGRSDGVVSRTDLCRVQYNATLAVGLPFSCAASGGGSDFGGPGGGSQPAINGTVSAEAAKIVDDFWAGLHDSKGRQAYVSYQPSSSLGDLSTTYNPDTSEYEVSPDSLGVTYVNQFLRQVDSNSFSLDNVTYDTLRDWMLEGMQKFESTLQTTWPNLEDFHDNGGKVIHFHGESDFSVPALSSVIYHNSVRKIMYPNLDFDESFDALHEWNRLFLIPGAGHCTPSGDQPNGPFPRTVVESLIDWVEKGSNPEQLNATVPDGNVTDIHQKLCSFPLRPMWNANSTMSCVQPHGEVLDTWFPTLDSIPLPVY